MISLILFLLDDTLKVQKKTVIIEGNFQNLSQILSQIQGQPSQFTIIYSDTGNIEEVLKKITQTSNVSRVQIVREYSITDLKGLEELFKSDGRVDGNYMKMKFENKTNSLNGVKILYIYQFLYDTPNRLSQLGASVYQVHVNSLSNISADSLCKYDVVLVDIQAIWSLGFLSASLQSYVSMGGGYWINQPNQTGNVPTLPAGFSVSISNMFWNCGTSSCQQYTPLAPLHPITSGLNIDETSGDYDIEGSWGNLWNILIIDTSHGPNDPTLMVGNYGNGRIAYTDHCFSWNCVDPGTNNYLERITKWLASGSCGTFTPLSNDEKAKLPFDKFNIKNGKLIINLINERYVRYEIFSINGRKIEERDKGFMKPGKYEIKLKLKNGLYVLKIYLDNISFTKVFEF